MPPVSIHPLDPDAAEPPFEQLRRQVAARAADGDLAPGTRLPTVRSLAEQLAVAPGTVARAYKELEGDGVLVTEGRRGTFVASGAAAGSSDAQQAASAFAAEARRLGLGLDDAVRLLTQAWRR